MKPTKTKSLTNINAIKSQDKELYSLLTAEFKRQQDTLSLIPSENYTYPEVLDILSSVTMNKYAEGYPSRRYYNGNNYIDQIENLAIERAKKLFKANYANVQAYSGSPANLAVYFALLEPHDKVMGLDLSHGGHLTHGAKVNFSGKWFNQIPIKLELDGSIDYQKVESSVKKERPKMIIAGVTAYPRELDYKKLSEIAKKFNAFLIADLSHTNGLVIAGLHKNPLLEGADVITTTTHKLLRGPRGALILTNNEELSKKINKAIMPGLQGGPHNNQTSAIAFALKKALTDEYKQYVKEVLSNSQHLSQILMEKGFNLVSNGTDNHLMLIDLRNLQIMGREAANLLEDSGIVTNANTIPNDPSSPLNPSGIRIGTPALTTRGLKLQEIEIIADLITKVLKEKYSPDIIREELNKLLIDFPIYPDRQI